mgnify:CR=1 FL=1
MAVYTKVTKEKLLNFLNNYNIGNLIKFEGILEGVENTNYKLTTKKNNFILTIFEKRVETHELPFFIKLQNHLFNKKIKCPQPILDNNKNFVNYIDDKSCVIMSFLEGKQIIDANLENCIQVGEELGKIHKHTKDFPLNRRNNLSNVDWKKIFQKCDKKIVKKEMYELIENELAYLEINWPKNLPTGIIHADLFQDNVFFINQKLSGIIDFYFACTDFYAYELAICINAWCFDKNKNFNKLKYQSILKGYQTYRKLQNEETKSIQILLRGAAMRFLLTRLYDQINHPDGALVNPKDPTEYFNILNFHRMNQKNKDFYDY